MSPNLTPHEISMAVWDIVSPVVVGRVTKMKVGAKCSGGCPLTGQEIEIRDEAEVVVGSGILSPTPWQGTSALYWTELDIAVPANVGTFSWAVTLRASAMELPHETTSSRFRFVTVPPPEHSVTVKVVDKATEAPVENVEVRMGVYRSATGESGLAKLDLPKGAYELVVCKTGYDAPARALEIASDITLQVELEIVPEPEQEYWMG